MAVDGAKDACSEWKKQQTKVLKVVRVVRDRKGQLSAKRRWMKLEVEGRQDKSATAAQKGGRRRGRACLLEALARQASVFRVEIISIGSHVHLCS